MLQGMSDLCMYEFEDIAWDEFCESDDHIVPHPESRRPGDYFVLGDSQKKPRREFTSISSNTGDRSAARYVDRGREQGRISSLNKRSDTMLEKDSLSYSPNGVFPFSSDSYSIKEASSLASENIRSSSQGLKRNKTDLNGSEFCLNETVLGDKTTEVDNNSSCYPLGDIAHTGSNIDFLENAENKDSGNFLYYGWPEIGYFDDVDRMFRSCDSTYGLGASKEDELGWFTSADEIGGGGDVLKSDVEFPCSEPNAVENASENHDSSEGYSISDSAMKHKDSSWTSVKSDSCVSFLFGPAIADSKDGFIPKEHGVGSNGKIQPRISINSHSRTGGAAMINEHEKQFKLQNHSGGRSKEHYFGNGSFNHPSDLPNEIMQLSSGLTSHQAFPSVGTQQQRHAPRPLSYGYLQDPISYVHADSSHLSDPASVNLKPSTVKSETNDITSFSPRESSHASSQLQYMKSSHVRERREKIYNRRGSGSSASSSLKNGSVTLQASVCNPGSVGKYENHGGPEGVSLGIPVELGYSNVQESSTMSSGLDDISLEAASFRQLQLVMERLDLTTKLCIRDSLYRLARSAEQRHNMNGSCGDERDASGAFIAEGTNKCTSFMDMETDTNPIDRSIAHLLFHRPSDSSAAPAHDPKSPKAVHGSISSPPVMVENLISEETAFEVEKVSD